MSRLGNISGPSKDDILLSIPFSRFGCSAATVEEEAWIERYSTVDGSVDPVELDEKGKPFCSFCASGGGEFRHYLDDKLRGDILVNMNAGGWEFRVHGSQNYAGKYEPIICGTDCEIAMTPDQHLKVEKGNLPAGIGIAEQVAAQQWRLRVKPPAAESPPPEAA